MWHLPAVPAKFEPGEVHLWRGLCVPGVSDVTAVTTVTPMAAAMLSAAEMARAGRLATPMLQQRYLQSHLLLRQLLSAYTGVPAQGIELAYSTHGKPYLATSGREAGLEFNMSHAGEMVVIALTRGCRVGVDVEQVRTLHDLEAMIAATCSQAERDHLCLFTGDAREAEFFRLWTRKEAWLKRIGVGLDEPLHTVDVLEYAGSLLLDVQLPEIKSSEVEHSIAYVASLALAQPIDPIHLRYWQATWHNN